MGPGHNDTRGVGATRRGAEGEHLPRSGGARQADSRRVIYWRDDLQVEYSGCLDMVIPVPAHVGNDSAQSTRNPEPGPWVHSS